jgi:hypothetical protein
MLSALVSLMRNESALLLINQFAFVQLNRARFPELLQYP